MHLIINWFDRVLRWKWWQMLIRPRRSCAGGPHTTWVVWPGPLRSGVGGAYTARRHCVPGWRTAQRRLVNKERASHIWTRSICKSSSTSNCYCASVSHVVAGRAAWQARSNWATRDSISLAKIDAQHLPVDETLLLLTYYILQVTTRNNLPLSRGLLYIASNIHSWFVHNRFSHSQPIQYITILNKSKSNLVHNSLCTTKSISFISVKINKLSHTYARCIVADDTAWSVKKWETNKPIQYNMRFCFA